MLGASENGADIIRFTQAVGHAGNVKRFVPAGNRFTTISKIFRTGIGGIQNTESEPALGACEFCTPGRVDYFACVHRRDHVSITAASSDVEKSHTLHEERAFFGVEDRKTLVDLNLECIALDLAEI